MKLIHSQNKKYCLSNVSYTYELQFENLTVSTDLNGDLQVSSEADGETWYHDEDDTKFWLGAVLFWYDTDSCCPWNVDQIDAIVRYAFFMGIVPCEDDIEKYCIPKEDEVYTYREMIDLLVADGNEKAIRIKEEFYV